tara:strand:+ start:1533 stop:1772 length:240 start_codon:yes stop_codon:yes gene_type:complete
LRPDDQLEIGNVLFEVEVKAENRASLHSATTPATSTAKTTPRAGSQTPAMIAPQQESPQSDAASSHAARKTFSHFLRQH